MSRHLGKSVAIAAAYGMRASLWDSLMNQSMQFPGSCEIMEPVRTKTKKPWQKGFIPTVGKKPELPAPVLGGEWQFRERTGNIVEYQLRSEDPFNWGWPRIKGDLVKRQWAVVVTKKDHQVHDASYYQEQTLFTSGSHKACVVFVALDPELTATKTGFDYGWGAPVFKTHTGRFSAMSPAPQILPKLAARNDPQLEYYRALMTEYCQKDMVVFDERHILKNKLAKLDKADDETV